MKLNILKVVGKRASFSLFDCIVAFFAYGYNIINEFELFKVVDPILDPI